MSTGVRRNEVAPRITNATQLERTLCTTERLPLRTGAFRRRWPRYFRTLEFLTKSLDCLQICPAYGRDEVAIGSGFAARAVSPGVSAGRYDRLPPVVGVI